ncbi:hypothetical protein SARC_04326 [Sphaeroforma arctica JP610]|uniref:Uncharacterized protein n=1 Tax=Sphaeroforma arctica JP610 TaxID=667725 RepID=A0A0L0G3G0_9EUKA|nr:hypothetical protein SARC_04326 [Sphaeroforma arctica JP610]KNC83409.1 hypothetical protein SARC_04326 [Sphaeroforma arctica JP610]|eukprot:XP_014157311.1 hypothetical protein SARC_04326 [Sphaeroforma arctica JP610]
MSEDQPRKTSLCLYFVDDVDQPGSCGDCKRPKEAHACSTRTTAYHSAVPFSPFTTRKRTTELASNPHMREIQPADSTGRASPGADSASGDEFLPSIESDAFMSTRQAASLRTKFITEMCDVTRRRPHLPSLSTIGKGDSSEDQNSELGTEGGNGRANSGSELGLNSEVDPESRVSGKGSQEDLSAEITINGCIEEVLLRFQAMLHWEGEVMPRAMCNSSVYSGVYLGSRVLVAYPGV